ncbi:hypothetical protein BDN67DRAFT_874976, partial [Paxillus ammoniavirescens]
DGKGEKSNHIVIPLPRGTLSRPNGGGYALCDISGWENSTYKTGQNGLHAVCKKHLNMTCPYHQQTPKALVEFFRVVGV